MRTIKTLTMVALMAGYAYGQSSGGTIPFVSSLDITYGSGNASALNAAAFGDYDAGLLDISGFISSAAFDANDSSIVAVKIGSWTLPADYPADGNKNSVTANSDFKMLISGITAGDEMVIQNSANALQELTSTDLIVLRAKDKSGVTATDFGADARVDLAWGKDPVGAYSVTVTFTVTQQ